MGAFFNFYSATSVVHKPFACRNGYCNGQHTNSRRNQRRAAIKAAGGIRQYKRRAHAAQGHRNG